MGLLDKLSNIGGNVAQIWQGGAKVLGGDWTGFKSVGDGVHGLFGDKDAMGKMVEGYGQNYKPSIDLSGYSSRTSTPGSAGGITELGDTARISDWSRNQAVAMYYLNMINKITTQGSPRKGA